MNIGILAARTQTAMENVSAAAEAVAKKNGIDPDKLPMLNATCRDKSVQLLLRLEAVAQLLELIQADPVEEKKKSKPKKAEEA